MAIKRFMATADTTIANAFLDDLTTRATGANIGLADSLEVYSIYGQASSSYGSGHSSELSRALIKFPVLTTEDSTNSIQAKRSAGDIPASGNVSFFFRLYNVAHHETLPTNAKYNIFAVSSSWEEGRGVDLDTYTDKTFDGVGANWLNANSSATAASGTITVSDADNLAASSHTIAITASNGSIITATAHASTTTSTDTDSPTFDIVAGDDDTTATNIATCLNANSKLTATAASSVVTVVQAAKGIAGNTVITLTDASPTGMTKADFVGGNGAWAKSGGDFHTGSATADLNSIIMYSQTLSGGYEDIEVDITHLVERWIRAVGSSNEDIGYNNYGIGVFLTSSQEAYFSSSTGVDVAAVPPENDGDLTKVSGGVLHNLEGATTSYYTKKFSARGSEYFFKRPTIEARWDSSIQDDRGSFYYSSSLANPAENLNTIYFYNYFRGQLRNLPDADEGTELIYVSFFSGNVGGTGPTGAALTLVDDKTHVNSSNVEAVTGGYVSTGIYSASVALTAALSPLDKIYDVWFKGSEHDHVSSSTAVHYYTGSLMPQGLDASSVAPYTKYASSITNLRKVYRSNETARFRVHTRLKDWSPTIYTKAVATPSVDIVESGSYEIYRVIDDIKAVPYGTGSLLHTRMSFDASGSYFDLDMTMLEDGYMYGIRLAYYNNSVGAWVDQPETFKFRVEG